MGAVRTLVDELRRRGATVHEWPGWDGRGNAGVAQIDPRGAVLHHTATPYGSAFQVLVTGRSDLAGALCNFSGNSDGSFTVVASGLAYHAGRGAGPSLGPLAPYAGNMNYYTVGLEIVYPGNSPMTDAQYRSMILFGRAVADLFSEGDAEYVRAHAETNGRTGDGKWDPGFAPGQTIDMAAVRRDIRNWSTQEDDLSAAAEQKIAELHKSVSAVYTAIRKDWSQVLIDMDRTNQMVLNLYLGAFVGGESTPDNKPWQDLWAQAAGKDVADVDEEKLAAILTPALLAAVTKLSDDQLTKFVDDVNDERDRRERERLEVEA